MEQQNLPNVNTALILGIVSFVCCCFSMGIGGLILSGIAFYLVKKDENLYKLDPSLYLNYSQLKTAKIVAIIGLVLGVLSLAYSVFFIISVGGIEGYMEMVNEMMEQYGA